MSDVSSDREQPPRTPKQQYEARKAARKAERADMKGNDTEQAEAMLDMLDRFTTAAERIADAMERIAQPPDGVAR